MKEIKETISILKARWPEAIVIVSLYTLTDAVPHLLQNVRTDPSKTAILSLVALILVVVATVLQYGFLRTVHLDSQRRQAIMTLYSIGRKFFSRAVGYGLIYVVCYSVLAWLTFLVIKRLTSIETGFFETMKSAPALFQLYVTVPVFVLVKVQLLVPAIILVFDCGVFESFKSMRRWRLLDSKELVALFCLNMAMAFIWGFVRVHLDPNGIMLYIVSSIKTIGDQVLGVIIAVTAVRFVGSHGSEVQNESRPTG